MGKSGRQLGEFATLYLEAMLVKSYGAVQDVQWSLDPSTAEASSNGAELPKMHQPLQCGMLWMWMTPGYANSPESEGKRKNWTSKEQLNNSRRITGEDRGKCTRKLPTTEMVMHQKIARENCRGLYDGLYGRNYRGSESQRRKANLKKIQPANLEKIEIRFVIFAVR
ncbi:uncharacterized protein BT62DRAFT_921536 [Guyanagaster necrorhizus]|uniref:Uncharacterized protein n=1 Tax=Guyanagaster necrorhizus TaxID=856835 RepID=A0A9P8ARH5_9AGAR|nr:uncharacterized protein BT62DRAFT_921536 [Guyanagaster necrorhizus MCA 3950]KAG7443872.1 hypothetical protein BT62DRAFT_921536 [Guyanagaster necrorhizus MCA 3950]